MTSLPDYARFRECCRHGLSVVRPLVEGAEQRDVAGWNYGSGWPPSYAAFGRLRVIYTLTQALALRPRRVLEIAAGDGALCACLAVQGVAACANDLRAGPLERALEDFTTGSQVRVLTGNCFDLDPAGTGSFDLVIACEAIEHVAHPVELLRHLKKFLNSGGRIFLTTPNGSYFRSRLPTYSQIEDPAALETDQFKPDADGHLFLITASEMHAMARQAGLVVEHLDLLATPFITGHCGLHRLAAEWMARPCYEAEKLCRQLPFALRERFCFLMYALLR